jgi:antitoxin CcdA
MAKAKSKPLPKLTKSPVNLSIPSALLKEARALEVNVSRAAASGIAAEIARLRGLKWREENREALEYYNDYIRANGLPLEKLRMF